MARPPGETTEREPLTGLVERVTFHSAETGFCILGVKVRGQRDLVTVLGSAAEIHAGEHIQASGHWEQHREHGPQFRALFLSNLLRTVVSPLDRLSLPKDDPARRQISKRSWQRHRADRQSS